MRVMAKPLRLVQEGKVLRWLYLGANDVTVVAVLNVAASLESSAATQTHRCNAPAVFTSAAVPTTAHHPSDVV